MGILKAQIVNRYCDLLPLLRPLLVFIKAWAKSVNLNDRSGRGGKSIGGTSFSTHALTLMTIGMFQVCSREPHLRCLVVDKPLQTKRFLPNLQSPPRDNLPEVEGESVWGTSRRNASTQLWDVRFDQLACGWKPPRGVPSLGEALQMWFT